MVSPPFKLKMFTGSVCVLLTSVSLKLIKIKIKLIYATTSSCDQLRETLRTAATLPTNSWRVHFVMIRVDPSPILFYFIFLFDPSRSDPDWRSELIRSDFCTCLAKMFVFSEPKISQVIMKWCLRASHLVRFSLWNNGGRRRASHLGRFTLWN